MFLRVVGLLFVWCLRGGGGEHRKKGVLAKNWAINKLICFHSKTVLLVLLLHTKENYCDAFLSSTDWSEDKCAAKSFLSWKILYHQVIQKLDQYINEKDQEKKYNL